MNILRHSILTLGLLAHAAGWTGELSISQTVTEYQDGRLHLEFDQKRTPGGVVQSAALIARHADGRELALMSPEIADLTGMLQGDATQRLELDFALPYLPPGPWSLVLKSEERAEPENSVLRSFGGRSLISIADYAGKDYELRFKMLDGTIPFVRAQNDVKQSSDTWNFDYLSIGRDHHASQMVFHSQDAVSKWDQIADFPINPPGANGWRQVSIRVEGDRYTVEIDGVKNTASSKQFTSGAAGFRSDDQGVAYIDDVELRDLSSGQVILSDDFERSEAGDRWHINGGKWGIERGIPVQAEYPLGEVTALAATENVELPVCRLQKHGDGIDLWINGAPVVPLIFSLGATSDSPSRVSTYEIVRNAYQAGVRLFAPLVTVKSFDADGNMALSGIDTVMAQLTTAAPEGRFILRLALPTPPTLPSEERYAMAKKAGDTPLANGFPDTKVESGFEASLASEQYPLYAAEQVARLIGHFKSNHYGRNIAGLLVTGGGYELNWGQPGPFPEYPTDTSPAQRRRYGDYLRGKYSSVEALRQAWNDPTAEFDSPAVPFIGERTISDLAGFRDPSQGKSRRVLDFIDCYTAQGDTVLKPIFDAVAEHAPDSFFGVFSLFSLNGEWAATGPAAFPADYPMLEQEAVSFLGGILTYHDRTAGGVSVSTSPPAQSARLHGKMMLEEIDMRTPVVADAIAEGSWEEAAQSMRREFANVFLVERNAFWYFDMGYTGSWFNHPPLLEEMTHQLAVGQAALPLERKSTAEIVVALSPESWHYWGITPTPSAPEAAIPFSSVEFAMNFCTFPLESLMRMGAPADVVLLPDLPEQSKYKLYIFPSLFHCDAATRERIHQLASDGAVCLLMGPAGLIDDRTATVDNMEKLLDMPIVIDPPGIWKAVFTLPDGTTDTIGAGSYTNNFNMRYLPVWHRFRIAEERPELEILARYEDGGIAMAKRRIGRGALVYSALPITHPAAYRELARLAGVPVYSDSNDAFYANGDFAVIHTATAGMKTIRLPEPAPEVREVFTGEVIGHNVRQFTVELPAKHTAVYYIGSNPDFLTELDRISIGKAP